MPTIPYIRATHSDGQSWSAAKGNALEGAANDAHYMPAVRVFHNTTQSHSSSGTYQAVAFNSERYDQAGNVSDTQHDTSSNTRLTCKYAGVYHITGHLQFASNSTGVRHVQIRLNGSTIIGEGPVINTNSNDLLGRVLVSTDYALAVNDYVELLAYQSSGGALNITNVSNTSPEFMMHRVG